MDRQKYFNSGSQGRMGVIKKESKLVRTHVDLDLMSYI